MPPLTDLPVRVRRLRPAQQLVLAWAAVVGAVTGTTVPGRVLAALGLPLAVSGTYLVVRRLDRLVRARGRPAGLSLVVGVPAGLVVLLALLLALLAAVTAVDRLG